MQEARSAAPEAKIDKSVQHCWLGGSEMSSDLEYRGDRGMQHSKTSSCKADGTSCHRVEVGLSLSHQALTECVCKPRSSSVVFAGELARHLQQNVTLYQVFTTTTAITILGSSVCVTSKRACCERWLWQAVNTGQFGQSGSGQSLGARKNNEGKKAHYVVDV